MTKLYRCDLCKVDFNYTPRGFYKGSIICKACYIIETNVNRGALEQWQALTKESKKAT